MKKGIGITRHKLENISESIEYGLTASANKNPVGPRFLRITDIQDDFVRWEDVPYCECPASDMNRYELREGDIVFARTGATTGKSYLIRECPEPAVFASYLIRVRPSSIVCPGFLAYFFRTPDYWRQVSGAANGSTQPGVNGSRLKELSVPLPPLSEQRRIAAILDKADAIRRKREEGIRLTEELLRSTFLEMFGDPMTNPKSWKTQPICSIVKEMEGGKSILAEADEAASTPYRVLKVSAVTWADYQPHESKPVPADYIPPTSHIVKKGDLLFSRANTTELVGATVYVFDTPPNHLLPDKLWRFVWHNPDTVDPQFIRVLFKTTSIKHEIGKRATGTSGSMKNISKAKLMTIPIPVPPFNLQQKFGKFAMAQHRLLADRREGVVSTANLFASLVQRAFRGEL